MESFGNHLNEGLAESGYKPYMKVQKNFNHVSIFLVTYKLMYKYGDFI